MFRFIYILPDKSTVIIKKRTLPLGCCWIVFSDKIFAGKEVHVGRRAYWFCSSSQSLIKAPPSLNAFKWIQYSPVKLSSVLFPVNDCNSNFDWFRILIQCEPQEMKPLWTEFLCIYVISYRIHLNFSSYGSCNINTKNKTLLCQIILLSIASDCCSLRPFHVRWESRHASNFVFCLNWISSISDNRINFHIVFWEKALFQIHALTFRWILKLACNVRRMCKNAINAVYPIATKLF